jgi:hypothetical protein
LPAIVLGVEVVFRSLDIERDALAAWIVLTKRRSARASTPA